MWNKLQTHDIASQWHLELAKHHTHAGQIIRMSRWQLTAAFVNCTQKYLSGEPRKEFSFLRTANRANHFSRKPHEPRTDRIAFLGNRTEPFTSAREPPERRQAKELRSRDRMETGGRQGGRGDRERQEADRSETGRETGGRYSIFLRNARTVFSCEPCEPREPSFVANRANRFSCEP